MAKLSEAMGHLWNNLNDLCEKDPQKYEEFMTNASQEHDKLSSSPEPHSCFEIFCDKTGACSYLNLLSWKRVEIPQNDPDALPLAGGILQKNSSLTYVATRPDLIDDHFVKVGPSFKEHFMQIVFDFLEHQNPDVRFSRQWVLSKDKFVGSKEEMIASFSPALTTSLNHNKELLASPISLVQKIRHGSNGNDEMSPLKELPSLARNPEDELRASSKPTILLPKSKEVSLKSVQTRKLQPLVPLFGRRECPSNKVIYFKVYLPEISNKEHSLSAINNQTNHLIVQTTMGHALSTPIFPVEPVCQLSCSIDYTTWLNHVLTICIAFNTAFKTNLIQ